jgi:hypothetical protein
LLVVVELALDPVSLPRVSLGNAPGRERHVLDEGIDAGPRWPAQFIGRLDPWHLPEIDPRAKADVMTQCNNLNCIQLVAGLSASMRDEELRLQRFDDNRKRREAA